MRSAGWQGRTGRTGLQVQAVMALGHSSSASARLTERVGTGAGAWEERRARRLSATRPTSIRVATDGSGMAQGPDPPNEYAIDSAPASGSTRLAVLPSEKRTSTEESGCTAEDRHLRRRDAPLEHLRIDEARVGNPSW